jgi:heavy metal sensor kinase
MSLTARLSAFFLGALALVLVGFSAALYGLARSELYRKLDDRLTSALDILAGAVEVDEQGLLEWEPHERPLLPGQEAGEDQVRWTVCDQAGAGASHSKNLGPEVPEGDWPALREDRTSRVVERGGQPWRFMRRRIQSAVPGSGQLAKPKYRELTFTAGISQAPVQATLRNLTLALVGLSGTLWLVATFVGRWLCRRALVPLTTMAARARAMSAADWDQRLPSPGTGDELEDLGQAFNDLLARLYQAFERQRRFTGDASHQLRTPLATALGQIEVALRRDRSAEDYRQVLTRLHGQAVHLRQIVEMLLFLARADGEAKLPNLETVDLAAWLNEHLQRWSGHPRTSDVRVEQLAGGPLFVLAQPPLLGQLLDNLLDNACKFSSPGTPIRLRLEREDGVAACSVEDQGCGIAAEDLPHVFEPFYRSAQVRRHGSAGVGLGLAVAQRIAAAFGGSLDVQSVPKEGSRFVLRLPEAAETGLADAALATAL